MKLLLNRKHEMFLNRIHLFLSQCILKLNRKHEMFLNYPNPTQLTLSCA